MRLGLRQRQRAEGQWQCDDPPGADQPVREQTCAASGVLCGQIKVLRTYIYSWSENEGSVKRSKNWRLLYVQLASVSGSNFYFKFTSLRPLGDHSCRT